MVLGSVTPEWGICLGSGSPSRPRGHSPAKAGAVLRFPSRYRAESLRQLPPGAGPWATPRPPRTFLGGLGSPQPRSARRPRFILVRIVPRSALPPPAAPL